MIINIRKKSDLMFSRDSFRFTFAVEPTDLTWSSLYVQYHLGLNYLPGLEKKSHKTLCNNFGTKNSARTKLLTFQLELKFVRQWPFWESTALDLQILWLNCQPVPNNCFFRNCSGCVSKIYHFNTQQFSSMVIYLINSRICAI